MWRNLTLTRRQAAAAEGAEGEAEAETASLPPHPTVHVSDLQTVSSAIVEANATSGFVFRPSSVALLDVQRGANASAAAAVSPSKPAASGAGMAAGGGVGYDAGKVVCVEKNDTWTIVRDVIVLRGFYQS